MAFHRPEEESLDPDGISRLQRRKLQELWSTILPANPFYRKKLTGISFDPRTDPFDRLPLTTREELQRDQAVSPPYGTNLTFELLRYCRFHQTSGTTGSPLRWLDTPQSWEWFKHCWCVIFRAAGVTERDRLMFPFSFGPFIGFWAAFEGAVSLGNLALPAGGMTTTARLRCMIENEVTVVCCTPTYARRMCEVATEQGMDLASSAVRLLIVAGEPGGNLPPVRASIEAGFGARVIDHAGMTEIGAYGVECFENPGGMHIIESEFIAEVIAPETLLPVAEGQFGELVLTNLGRHGSPLIRYRTGDRVRMVQEQCVCGRWFARLDGGILGRFDDMLIVRGNNVFPAAIEGVLREFPQVGEFRLVVEEREGMNELRIEVEPADDGKAAAGETDPASAEWLERIRESIQDRFHFRPEVAMVPRGSLPRFEMKARRVTRGLT